MKTSMIVSIGPVQDFIATARKSRDLYFGSWLLSELSRLLTKGGFVYGQSSDSPD